nr:hypothetical protein [Tanacetum cinerariifolium]
TVTVCASETVTVTVCASETVTAHKTHVQPDNLNAQDIPEPTANIFEETLRGTIKDPIEEW